MEDQSSSFPFSVSFSLPKMSFVYALTGSYFVQMHKKHTLQSVVLGKDTFSVTVYPNIDHAFITALVVILEEIDEDRDGDD